MPLKHTTETFLVFLLGVVILATGFLLSTLPDLPQGATAWGILFILALIYPISLIVLFRNRRADHVFRVLHWYPAAMLLLWLVLQIAAMEKPGILRVVDWFTWGWSFAAVTFAFILIIGYCLQVIRRRIPRIVLLLVAFVPFVALAFTSQQGPHYEKLLSSVLWDHSFIRSLEGKKIFGLQIAKSIPIKQNLNSSQDSSEEAWRVKLRAAEDQRKEARLEKRKQGSVSSTVVVSDAGNGSGKMLADSRTKPKKLPSSGPEDIALLGVIFFALYGAVLQKRAMGRAC